MPPLRVWPVDYLTFAFYALAALATLLARGSMAYADAFLAADVAIVAAAAAIARFAPPNRPRVGAVLRLVHGCVATPVVFTQTGYFVRDMRGVDYAALLERVDRALFFGVNPLEAIEAAASPMATLVMQLAYTSYLALPPLAVSALAWRASPRTISSSCFALLGTMFLSYLGYVAVPASGPNLHNNFGPIADVSEAYRLPLQRDLYTFQTNLPGPPPTEALRRWMFDVEKTKQDCFPSGHVAVAFVCWALARRADRRLGPWFFGAAVAVALSTVYLRYHYVADVIAGVALAWFALRPWSSLHDVLLARSAARTAR
jgi:membrane-associated phospholipid phosphatase